MEVGIAQPGLIPEFVGRLPVVATLEGRSFDPDNRFGKSNLLCEIERAI
jgi:ATP-dependent protease Clp ATPase subunit